MLNEKRDVSRSSRETELQKQKLQGELRISPRHLEHGDCGAEHTINNTAPHQKQASQGFGGFMYFGVYSKCLWLFIGHLRLRLTLSLFPLLINQRI